ncbi:hypothetical protein [Caballeronia sp. GACF4]|uniref:hypothetical protein n=1 Tax=Caballeronia sp. GACF4 TaxID=2921763 RepID=UPI00202846A7|nr:hypothetical protein [Caballeronia sp. GACF4]
MAEATQFSFTHQELVTLMLQKQGIHEGYWGLLVNFGLGAGNIGPSNETLNPTSISAVTSIGIQRSTELNNLSVDAAVVNPKTDDH